MNTETNHNGRMEPFHWIPTDTSSLLDVGCNTGELLVDCHRRFPKMKLAGIDINHSALQMAKTKLPDAEIRQGYGFQLDFPDDRFQCVTCIEVIEHVPEQQRQLLLSEIRRVLVPGGRLVLRCPHDGIFSWLDAQNFRFRLPRLYKALVGEGGRDINYREAEEELVWHHHFNRDELLGLAGAGWEVETCQFGGLILFPISDILRWPFYRRNSADHWMAKGLERMATAELGWDFGKGSYGILLVLRKSPLAAIPPGPTHEDRIPGA